MAFTFGRLPSLLGAVGLLLGASAVTAAGCGNAGATPEWAACTAPGQCRLAAKGCCANCAPFTIDGLNAVNTSQEEAYQDDNCPDRPPSCDACTKGSNPTLAAFCVENACKVIDVRGDDVAACTTDADCRLRYSGCCERCGQGSKLDVIALGQKGVATYVSQVCAPGQTCPDCAPTYPVDAQVACGAAGLCEVVTFTLTCPKTVPEAQSACPGEGLVCEYGSDPRPSCRERAECVGGAWSVAVAKCSALPGPGQDGCPTTANDVSDCADEGLVCDLGSGATCACGICAGGPCSMIPHWSCATSPSGECPHLAPQLGSSCALSSIICNYGTCGTATSAGRHCVNGLWVDQPVSCSY
jgi:hypothetical protein